MSRHFLQVWAAMGVMVMCMYQLGRDKKGLMSWGSVAEHVLTCGQRRLDVRLSGGKNGVVRHHPATGSSGGERQKARLLSFT